MSDFNRKVAQLKEEESYVYTICLSMLVHEPEALALSKKVLCELFRDEGYWQLAPADRPKSLLKHCIKAYAAGLSQQKKVSRIS